jgi:hypothetical protein
MRHLIVLFVILAAAYEPACAAPIQIGMPEATLLEIKGAPVSKVVLGNKSVYRWSDAEITLVAGKIDRIFRSDTLNADDGSDSLAGRYSQYDSANVRVEYLGHRLIRKFPLRSSVHEAFYLTTDREARVYSVEFLDRANETTMTLSWVFPERITGSRILKLDSDRLLNKTIRLSLRHHATYPATPGIDHYLSTDGDSVFDFTKFEWAVGKFNEWAALAARNNMTGAKDILKYEQATNPIGRDGKQYVMHYHYFFERDRAEAQSILHLVMNGFYEGQWSRIDCDFPLSVENAKVLAEMLSRGDVFEAVLDNRRELARLWDEQQSSDQVLEKRLK